MTAALIVVTAGAVAWVAARSPQPTDGTGWFARQSRAAGRAFAQATTAQQVTQLLAERSAAVRKHQPGRFVSGVATAARSDQRVVFQRLAPIPFAVYRARPRPGWRPASAELAAGRLTVPVRLTTRLPPDAAAATGGARARFRLVAGRWRLVGMVPRHPQVWDLAAVTAATGSRGLTLVAAGVDDPQRVSAEADLAADAIDRTWPLQWPGQVVVVLPRTTDQLADIVGVSGSAAVAAITSFRDGRLGRVVRIQLNPVVFPHLTPAARQILLRHEITHAAQYGRPSDDVPVWLAEGVAEYLGYRGSGVPDAVVAAELLADVRSGQPPDHLPRAADFAFRGGERERRLAYEQAWSLCRTVIDRYGQSALFSVYRQVSGRADRSVGAALQSVIGIGPAELLAQWRDWLRGHA